MKCTRKTQRTDDRQYNEEPQRRPFVKMYADRVAAGLPLFEKVRGIEDNDEYYRRIGK